MKPGFEHSSDGMHCKVWLLAKACTAARAQKLRKVTAAAVKADAIMVEAASDSSSSVEMFSTSFLVVSEVLK